MNFENNQLGECTICNLRGPLTEIRMHMHEQHLSKYISKYFPISSNILEFTVTDTVEIGDSIKWAPHQVLLLIRLVEENFDNFNTQVKKKIWVLIAEKMSLILNKKITHEQIDNKWKGLKKTYKKIKDENKRSGNAPLKWEFFNVMDSFMKKRPEIIPLATCDTVEGLQLTSKETTDSNVEATNDNGSSFFRKKKRYDSDIQKRHDEKMARLDEYLKLYKQSLQLKAAKKD
ncbi:hypothetical protein ABEB36_011086 [Hypothenemus hampei]|uniref:Myb/SANT-like DNA-binding domain-containing protein n=1 Tax=Hypothenemus hampei TaxID=57062 RepID=A0ABD1EED8_HYPHA